MNSETDCINLAIIIYSTEEIPALYTRGSEKNFSQERHEK